MYSSNTIATLTYGYTDLSATIAVGEQAYVIDATSDEVAIAFVVSKDITFDQVGIHVHAVTGSPTYTVNIEGLNTANGYPDGTVKSSATAQWAPSATGFNYITLGASHSATQGDVLVVRIKDGTTGTNPDASNKVEIRALTAQFEHGSLPYIMYSTDTGSTWAKVNEVRPSVAVRNSATTTDVVGLPVQSNSFYQIPSEIVNAAGEIGAQKFLIEPDFGRRVKVCGMQIRWLAPLGDTEIGIWDASGNEIASYTLESNFTADASSDYTVFFSSDVWLDTNTVYYAGIKFGAIAAWIYVHECDRADDLSAFPNYPNNNYSHYNGSTWTDQTGVITVGVNLFVTAVDTASEGIQKIGRVKR